MSKNGMAGGLSTKNFRMSLSHLPDPKTKYTITFSDLSGGLNIYDLDYRLDANESPDVRNLHWRDGALGCRSGQEWVSNVVKGTTYACYERDFWDQVFVHIADKLYFLDPTAATVTYHELSSGVPQNSGVFFRYGDHLMYKNRGGYYKIVYTPPASSETPITDCFHAYAVGNENFPAYTPVIYTAMNPTTHAGTAYQPENRISPKKTVWYSAVANVKDYYLPVSGVTEYEQAFVDNETHTFEIDEDTESVGKVTYLETESSEKAEIPAEAYTVDLEEKTVTITDSTYYDMYEYQVVSKLPQISIEKITISGTEQSTEPSEETKEYDDNETHVFSVNNKTNAVTVSYKEDESSEWTEITDTSAYALSTELPKIVTITDGTYYGKYKYQIVASLSPDYTFTSETGCVHFTLVPPVPNPFEANTVHITYSKANADAYNSIMDCDKAIVYGGDQNLCVVVAGCPAQPNAYFWNGNNIVMDPGYFPMEQYNLAGDTEEKVTGFGKQQGYLIIFKERGIGRSTISTTTISSGDNARLYLQLPYTAINSTVGCDLPGSIQLIKNNLVFCNTKSGVYLLSDSSAAHENNVVDMSRKVNGGPRRSGLLEDVSVNPGAVHSTNFHENYWLIAGNHAYLWDYELSDYTDPTWFYYTNIASREMFQLTDTLYHFDTSGRLTVFTDSFSDYGIGIQKTYQFATQTMGTFNRLKTVTDVIFDTRADTVSVTNLIYVTDYEVRADLTPIDSRMQQTMPRDLTHRDLTYRNLGTTNFSTVARRRPMCRHIKHFAMRLENNTAGHDLSIISAQLFYTFQGGQR